MQSLLGMENKSSPYLTAWLLFISITCTYNRRIQDVKSWSHIKRTTWFSLQCLHVCSAIRFR